MNTNEHIQAAAQIACGMVSRAYETGQLQIAAPGKLQEIARVAVALAQEIEREVRRSQGATA